MKTNWSLPCILNLVSLLLATSACHQIEKGETHFGCSFSQCLANAKAPDAHPLLTCGFVTEQACTCSLQSSTLSVTSHSIISFSFSFCLILSFKNLGLTLHFNFAILQHTTTMLISCLSHLLFGQVSSLAMLCPKHKKDVWNKSCATSEHQEQCKPDSECMNLFMFLK